VIVRGREKPDAPDRSGRRSVADAATCTSGTLGSRLPSSMPDTTLTVPAVSVDVSVDLSSELFSVPDSAKFRYWLGAAVSSISAPWLIAFGTLNTRRDEHEPAVTISWRSRMSMWNADTLSDARPPMNCDLAPTS
jgi:hypothetical protein